MAERLNPAPVPPRRRPRGLGFLALTLGVAVVHGCVTRELGQRLQDASAAAPMPSRLEVAYVRVLEPEAPPQLSAPPVVPPAAAPVRRSARAAAVRPTKAASAAEALEPAPAANVEERRDPQSLTPSPSPQMATASELSDLGAASGAPSAGGAAPAEIREAAGDAAGGPPAAQATAPADVAGQAFEWPASTRVTFALTGNYRGEVSGQAGVEWIRVGSRYQVHLDILVGPAVAPLVRRRMTSDGELTPEGLAPRRYDEDTQAMFRDRRRVTVQFEPDRVVLASGETHERWPGMQDTASQFIQLSFLFAVRPDLLRVGGSVEMPLALPKRADRWVYDVLADDTVQTPFGPLETVHLKPRRSRPKPGELNAEIWFAPQLRYLPVRIRIEQDPETWVDLVIERKPELAAR